MTCLFANRCAVQKRKCLVYFAAIGGPQSIYPRNVRFVVIFARYVDFHIYFYKRTCFVVRRKTYKCLTITTRFARLGRTGGHCFPFYYGGKVGDNYVFIVEGLLGQEVCRFKEYTVAIAGYVYRCIFLRHAQYVKVSYVRFKRYRNPLTCLFRHGSIIYQYNVFLYFTAVGRIYRVNPRNIAVLIKGTSYVNIHAYGYFRAFFNILRKTYKRLVIAVGFFRLFFAVGHAGAVYIVRRDNFKIFKEYAKRSGIGLTIFTITHTRKVALTFRVGLQLNNHFIPSAKRGNFVCIQIDILEFTRNRILVGGKYVKETYSVATKRSVCVTAYVYGYREGFVCIFYAEVHFGKVITGPGTLMLCRRRIDCFILCIACRNAFVNFFKANVVNVDNVILI